MKVRTTQNLPLLQAFAAEMKAQRNALSISQEELAFRCQVNRTFIAKIELAKNQPSLTVLLKIAEGMQVELPVLIEATLKRYGKEIEINKS